MTLNKNLTFKEIIWICVPTKKIYFF